MPRQRYASDTCSCSFWQIVNSQRWVSVTCSREAGGCPLSIVAGRGQAKDPGARAWWQMIMKSDTRLRLGNTADSIITGSQIQAHHRIQKRWQRRAQIDVRFRPIKWCQRTVSPLPQRCAGRRCTIRWWNGKDTAYDDAFRESNVLVAPAGVLWSSFPKRTESRPGSHTGHRAAEFDVPHVVVMTSGRQAPIY